MPESVGAILLLLVLGIALVYLTDRSEVPGREMEEWNAKQEELWKTDSNAFHAQSEEARKYFEERWGGGVS